MLPIYIFRRGQAIPLAPKLFRCSSGKGKGYLGEAVLVGGVGVGDVRLGFLQLSLCEFHDGAETQVIAGLGEIQSEAGLLAKLLRDRKPFVGTVGVLPGDADVAGDVVAKIGEPL